MKQRLRLGPCLRGVLRAIFGQRSNHQEIAFAETMILPSVPRSNEKIGLAHISEPRKREIGVDLFAAVEKHNLPEFQESLRRYVQAETMLSPEKRSQPYKYGKPPLAHYIIDYFHFPADRISSTMDKTVWLESMHKAGISLIDIHNRKSPRDIAREKGFAGVRDLIDRLTRDPLLGLSVQEYLAPDLIAPEINADKSIPPSP